MEIKKKSRHPLFIGRVLIDGRLLTTVPAFGLVSLSLGVFLCPFQAGLDTV